jgi:hypothetical protein
MRFYGLLWSSGGVSGVLTIWAPTAAHALTTVRAYPSWFAIPHADPIVGRPRCVVITGWRLERAA